LLKTSAVKKGTLIQLYWILDSLQRGTEPNSKHVDECFISIRDSLMDPDTEDIVDHIRVAFEQSKAAAALLTHQVIGSSRRMPLADHQLIEMMRHTAAPHSLPVEVLPEVAVAFGRLVEAAHGIE